MFPGGFKPTIPATERLQTHAFELAATGIRFTYLIWIFVHKVTSIPTDG
jgi:hypothetical protein